MLKVAYNYQTFTQQSYGGISRLFVELAPLVAQDPRFAVKIYGGYYQNRYLPELRGVPVLGTGITYPPLAFYFFSALNPLIAQAALGIDRPDIVHETYYSGWNTVPRKAKTIVSVYDLIHERFQDSMGNSRLRQAKAQTIRRADHIICVSENTRRDLIEMFEVPPEKLSTIYVGYAATPGEASQDPPMVDGPYLLYVGLRRDYYKNFDRLLRAYGNSPLLRSQLKLVCFGYQPFSPPELETISTLGLTSDQVLYFSGGDRVLINLYRHGQAFVYPSLYEGFGIPPLEAMSCGCPVVCSNISSIPEVVGAAGEYFDPYDLDSIGQAIERVISSETRRQELIALGWQRIQKFSWAACAEQTMAVYLKTS
jgi:glycosyltransferase involved in cell wall biosynthesis